MRVITNTAISLDGRISTDINAPFTLGSAYDQEHMRRLRGKADAVLVGGNTFRMLSAARAPLDPPALPIWNIIISRRLDFELTHDFLSHPYIRPLVITTENAAYAKPLPIDVIASRTDPTPEWIVMELEKRGVRTLLIEAGGSLIFQFLRDNLIDEMYVTLCPKIMGVKGAPTIVDGDGFTHRGLKNLMLLSSKSVGDELFLHYSVKKD